MKLNPAILPETLQRFFAENRRIALAFSGGCDSALLLWAAKACGAEPGVYYVKSPFQPEFELEDAKKLSDELGCGMRILEINVLEEAAVRANPADRCYHCKQRIFRAILEAAQADGYTCVMDGTNASDDASGRPGMRALMEMQVRSPLREGGITKAQVRALSREAGLFTWNKPAYACLATRIPAGTEISETDLSRIEQSESALAAMGFSDFRVRMDGQDARLEITETQLPLLLEKRCEIIAALESDFKDISLNLRFRKGLEL